MAFTSLRNSRRRRRCAGRWLTPPPPSRAHFPVKSLAQLGFFVRGKGRNFYLLYPKSRWRRHPAPLSIWPGKGGFLVCPELGPGQRFLSHKHCVKSFLGQAIAEGRLYVLWDI